MFDILPSNLPILPIKMRTGIDTTENTLGEHRAYLYRYALLHLRDPEQAEDAVQETLLSAVKAVADFQGRASLRTWLIAILKHKIIDHIRKAAQEQVPVSQLNAADEDEAADREGFFNSTGGWRDDRPKTWHDPDEAFERSQFWEIFQTCCEVLPRRIAQVFMLREVMGFSIEEICKDMQITTSNCSVILYRARLRLRNCLEKKWFRK